VPAPFNFILFFYLFIFFLISAWLEAHAADSETEPETAVLAETVSSFNLQPCGRGYARIDNLKIHEQVCLTLTFSCDYCGARVRNLAALNTHKSSQHKKVLINFTLPLWPVRS
jgi:hypothetical protein